MNKRIIYFLWFGLVCLNAHAADVEMKLDRNIISLLDRVILSVEFIDTKGDAIEFPIIDGLEIQYQGQSSETRIVNMQRTFKVIHRYLITPKQTGNFTIGPIQIDMPGGPRALQTQLQVIKSKNDSEAQQLSQLLYAEIASTHSNPYVYEPFDLTLKLYIREGIQIETSISIQGIDGAPPDWKRVHQEQQVIQGHIYTITTLKTTFQTITAGTFTFEPKVQLNIIVPRQDRRSYGFNDPFFGDFFGRQEHRPVKLECNTLSLPVRPIPQKNRPPTYTGAVGQFEFQASISPTELKTGEPLTLTSHIRGLGNLDKITPPILLTNAAYKLYHPRILPTAENNTLQFEQIIIPQSADLTQIPAIQFSYFNTQDESFHTLTAGPFAIELSPGDQARLLTSKTSPTDPTLRVLDSDIIHLKPQPRHWKNPHTLETLSSRNILIWIATPPLLWIAMFLWVRTQRRCQDDSAYQRRSKAWPEASHALKAAQEALKENDLPSANEALYQAIITYFGHRLDCPPGEVTCTHIIQAFTREQVALTELIEAIERNRYSPSIPSQETIQRQFKTTRLLLQKCERTRL
ncbi:MAG: BatD family protein [Pontiellaceae bacterium]